MTVIAWDGRTVAADSLCTFGGYRGPMPVCKIVRRGELVFANSGFHNWFNAWIDWYESGANPRETPVGNLPAERTGCFIVFKDGKAFSCTPEIPYLMECGAPDAWGCGCDFAIGAMKHGATAREAVEIAIDCSPQCGGQVLTIDLHHAPGPVEMAFERMRDRERGNLPSANGRAA